MPKSPKVPARIPNISCSDTRQDPDNKDLRIYRVFDRIEDATGNETETGHQLKGVAHVSDNKAMRMSLGSVLTNKQAVARDPLQMQLALEDGNIGEPERKKTQKGSCTQTAPHRSRNQAKGIRHWLEEETNLKSACDQRCSYDLLEF